MDCFAERTRFLPRLKPVGFRAVSAVTFPSDPERSPYDGIARLQFPDGEAMSEAMETETAAEMEADAAEFADTETMVQVVGETETLLDE